MSAANNGGAAFPSSHTYTDRDGDVCSEGIDGMTLRDYFAAKALPAVFGMWNGDSEGMKPFPILAGAAYAMADAMLAERAK